MVNIFQYPHQVLSDKAMEANLLEAATIIELLDEVYCKQAPACVGVAAPQIGYNKRIFIAEGEVFINPQLRRCSKNKSTLIEGCLSLRGKGIFSVPRSAVILLQWVDLGGRQRIKSFTGAMAQVIQHEYDHLEGRLICDYA